MTDTTVAANIHETLDVHLNFRTKGTFHLILIVDDGTQSVLFVIGPILYLLVLVDTSLGQDLRCKASSNAVDIGQTYNSSLVFG